MSNNESIRRKFVCSQAIQHPRLNRMQADYDIPQGSIKFHFSERGKGPSNVRFDVHYNCSYSTTSAIHVTEFIVQMLMH